MEVHRERTLNRICRPWRALERPRLFKQRLPTLLQHSRWSSWVRRHFVYYGRWSKSRSPCRSYMVLHAIQRRNHVHDDSSRHVLFEWSDAHRDIEQWKKDSFSEWHRWYSATWNVLWILRTCGRR